MRLGLWLTFKLKPLGSAKLRQELSVSYIDHNTIGEDFKNPDDHAYLQSIANKFGLYLSKAGNGIATKFTLSVLPVQEELYLVLTLPPYSWWPWFAWPVGAGGLDVALAMGGRPFYVKVPTVVVPHWKT